MIPHSKYYNIKFTFLRPIFVYPMMTSPCGVSTSFERILNLMFPLRLSLPSLEHIG